MSINSIEKAMELIQQGKQAEAQGLLKRLLSADPHNLLTWACYVKTCSTNEERITTLQICLKYNPDSKDVAQTLKKYSSLRGGSQAAPSVETHTPRLEKAVSSILSLLIYVTLLTILAAEIKVFMNTFFPPNGPSLGFAGLLVIPLGIIFFGAQEIAFTSLASFYIIRIKQQKDVTIAVLGMGILSAIALMIYLGLRFAYADWTSMQQPGMFSIEGMQFVAIWFIFGFVFVFTSGAGLAALLIMIGDVVVNTARLLSK